MMAEWIWISLHLALFWHALYVCYLFIKGNQKKKRSLTMTVTVDSTSSESDLEESKSESESDSSDSSDSDSLENWMILGRGQQDGDQSISLNLEGGADSSAGLSLFICVYPWWICCALLEALWYVFYASECVRVTKRIEAASIFYGPAHSEHLAYLQHIDKERVQPFTTTFVCVCAHVSMYICSFSVCMFTNV